MQSKFILRLAVLVLISTSAVRAQVEENDTTNVSIPTDTSAVRAAVVMLGHSYGDSVVLRWAPTTPGAWSAGNRFGYVIDRVRVIEGVVTPDMIERLTPTPIKPWSLDVWKARAARDNQWAAVAAQTLYGKRTTIAPDDEADIGSLYYAGVEFANRHGFALFAADNDATTAEGLALRLVDRNVKTGQAYSYRIMVVGDSTQWGFPIDTGYTTVLVEPYRAPEPPIRIEAVPLDGAIKVAWDDFSFSGFSGYHVYRSEDGGRTYKQLTKVPMTFASEEDTLTQRPLIYIDSAVVNYRTYHYQVRGITAFAELSDPAGDSTYARDLTPPDQPQAANPTTLEGGKIQLTWTIEDTHGDLDGFEIERGAKESGPYRIITDKPLARDARSFVVNDGNETEAYFVVTSRDTAGNLTRSLPVLGEIIDTIPPSVPRGLTGRIDTTGVVYLKWNLGSEQDIIGYRVLFANDSTNEFTQRTGQAWEDTTFTDTIEIRTLTQYIYYRIAAVDQRQNHSEMSDILQLERPDMVPPERSIFTNVTVSDSSVLLQWAISTSPDLARQILLRRDPGANVWKEIARLGPGIAFYEDRTVQQKLTYEYSLVAEDRGGLRSEQSPEVQGRPYDTGKRPGVQNLRATFDSDKRRINLDWTYTQTRAGEDYWFVVYRGGLEGELSQFKAIDKSARTFTDDNISTRPVYRYAVRVMTSSGESPFSDVVVVSLNR